MRNGGCDSRFIVSDSKANDCCFREALKDNVFHRPPSPHTCCVDPAADQEGEEGREGTGGTRSPGMNQPPFSHTHLSSSTSSPSDCYSSLPRAADPATSRGQLCSRGTSVRSHCVNQRLLIAGTLSGSGSQPRPAPSVWGL